MAKSEKDTSETADLAAEAPTAEAMVVEAPTADVSNGGETDKSSNHDPMIRITAKRSLRRAGMRHPEGDAEYPAARFTEAQLIQIEDEPDLIVTHF